MGLLQHLTLVQACPHTLTCCCVSMSKCGVATISCHSCVGAGPGGGAGSSVDLVGPPAATRMTVCGALATTCILVAASLVAMVLLTPWDGASPLASANSSRDSDAVLIVSPDLGSGSTVARRGRKCRLQMHVQAACLLCICPAKLQAASCQSDHIQKGGVTVLCMGTGSVYAYYRQVQVVWCGVVWCGVVQCGAVRCVVCGVWCVM